MLSNFLGVKAEQNLRDLSYPVSSFRKLRERLAVELDQFRWMIVSFFEVEWGVLQVSKGFAFCDFFLKDEYTAGPKNQIGSPRFALRQAERAQQHTRF